MKEMKNGGENIMAASGAYIENERKWRVSYGNRHETESESKYWQAANSKTNNKSSNFKRRVTKPTPAKQTGMALKKPPLKSRKTTKAAKRCQRLALTKHKQQQKNAEN